MRNLDIVVRSNDGTARINSFLFSGPISGIATEPLTMRLCNDDTENTIENLICAARVDFIGVARTGEEAFESAANGQELITEGWLQGRKGTSGAWIPLVFWPAALDLGPIAAGNFETFQVRLLVPADAASIGLISFTIAVHSR